MCHIPKAQAVMGKKENMEVLSLTNECLVQEGPSQEEQECLHFQHKTVKKQLYFQ